MDSKLNRNKVILGLSGGVDSTAAALILQEKGYEVIGLYFNVLSDFCINSKANIETGRNKAEKAAQQLGIKLIYRDMAEEFDRLVADQFCHEYASGRTPNPCVICNPLIKFRALIEAADEEGAYHIATGHYAGTLYDENLDRWFITKGKNEKKDQSYMLYRLDQNMISRLIMPLDDYEDKEEIRELARRAGISNSEDKDSQEICFIDPADTYVEYMKRKGFDSAEGNFTDKEGNVLGPHSGIEKYTVGQRKGLGIALGKPAFVTKIDSETKNVILGENEELFKKTIKSTGNILCKQLQSAKVSAKIRYAAKPAEAQLTIENDNTVIVDFAEAQRAPTPGQSVVFYDGDIVLGGGFIE